jgi:8-oxo-dGTP diphosphatase
MVQRSAQVSLPGAWCFPGGHIEPGETPRRAIIRELVEELGILVRPTQRLGAVRVLNSSYVLVVWRVDHLSGSFRLAEMEIAAMRWVPIEDILTIEPGMASNAMVVQLLRQPQNAPTG